MYRIDSGIKFINGERVDTFIRGIIGESTVMEVEAGTNGYHGGDRENGSRTYLRLTALNKVDFFARLKNNDAGQPVGVELCFCGDDGLSNVLKALDFAKQVLTDQLNGENS